MAFGSVRHRMLMTTATLSLLALGSNAILPATARAQMSERVKRLEQIIQRQQRLLAEQETRLKELEGQRGGRRDSTARNTGAHTRRLTIRPAPVRSAGDEGAPFLKGVRDMFRAMSDKGLAEQRGGAIPVYRVYLPDGSSLLVPAAAIDTSLAQAPPVPEFEVEPQPRRTAPPRGRQLPRRAAPRRAPAPPVARPTPPPPPSPPPVPAAPSVDDSERVRPEKAQDQALLERGAILLRRGTLQIEPGVEYSHYGSNNVQISGVSIFDAIIIGFIRVDALERDVLTGTLRVRYGAFNRLQLDATVPYVYRRDREVLGVGTPNVFERTINGHGIGDVEIGVSGQPLIGRGWIPNVLIRAFARFPTGESAFTIPTEVIGPGNQRRLIRSPTGNGFYSVGATVTGVLPIDPVVLFAGAGYTANLPRTFEDFGQIDPGDSWEFFAGLNFALNERVSFNASFINQRAFPTFRDGASVPNTSAVDSRVILGTSVGLTRNVNLVVNAGIGLTSQSPNFTFFVSLPITFRPFD